MTLEHVKRGQRAKAADQNDLIDAVNALGVRIIKRPEHYSDLALFELSSDVTFPDLDGASETYFDRDPTPYAEAKRSHLWQFNVNDVDENGDPVKTYSSQNQGTLISTVWFPCSFYNEAGYAVGHPCAREGDLVLCWFNTQSGRWEAIAPPLDVWRFELSSALGVGSDAGAYLYYFDGADWVVDDNIEFTVYDALGKWRGRGKDVYADPNNTGSRGYAKFMPDIGRWEVIELQPAAVWIRGKASAALLSTDEHMTGYDVVATQPMGAVIVQQDPADDFLEINNIHGFEADADALFDAMWNQATNTWDLIQIDCPAEE